MKELNINLRDLGNYKVNIARRNQFEVKDGFTRFVVNLGKKSDCKG